MISFHWILIITIIQIGFYSLGIEQNFNIFESNLLNIIPDEVAWNTGGKTGITEKDSKSIFCQKFIIDKLLNNNKKNKAKSKYIEVMKKLDYKTFVNKTNKKYNLELLNQTMKEYLYGNISKKYKNFNQEYNKIIIERLLQDEENNLIFNFIFNKIKIEDWLDIYVCKKELEFHVDIDDLKDYQIDMIKENLVRIDEIDTNGLYEMYEKDKLYFHCFMLLLYNFKRFFELKEDRKEKRKLK